MFRMSQRAMAVLRAELRPDDVVLVKASRAIGLEVIAAELLRWRCSVRLVLVAVIVGLIIGFVVTPLWANWLRARGYAQSIRDAEELGYAVPDHAGKKGTPSMGGVVIVAGTVLSYAAAHLIAGSGPSASALLVLFLMVGLASVGFADDYIKIFRRRSTGLRVKTKLVGQAVVAIVFALLVLQFPNVDGLTPATQYISFVRDTAIFLPLGIYLLWVWFMVAATSNAVNISDGLDGLAVGAASMVFGAYVTVGLWQYNQRCAEVVLPNCYEVRNPLDLAVVAAGVMGSCFGFLWWNTSPARIFMGDTGIAGSWRRHGRHRDLHPDRAAASGAGWLVRGHHRVGHHPDRLVQVDRAPSLSHDPHPSPLRAQGLARGSDRHEVLDHLGLVHRSGLRPLLYRVARWRRHRVTDSSTVAEWLRTADRAADWSGVRACVAGLGKSGFAAADALLRVGAQVEVVEAAKSTGSGLVAERAQILSTLGASCPAGCRRRARHRVRSADSLSWSSATSPVDRRCQRWSRLEWRAVGVESPSADRSLAHCHWNERQDHRHAATQCDAARRWKAESGRWQHRCASGRSGLR